MSSVTRRCPGMVPTASTRMHEPGCWNARPLKPSSGSSGHLYSLVITLLKISLLQQLTGAGWGSIRKLLKQLHTISPPFLAIAGHPLPASSSQCLRGSPIFSLIQCWQERAIFIGCLLSRHRKSWTHYPDFTDKATEAQRKWWAQGPEGYKCCSEDPNQSLPSSHGHVHWKGPRSCNSELTQAYTSMCGRIRACPSPHTSFM